MTSESQFSVNTRGPPSCRSGVDPDEREGLREAVMGKTGSGPKGPDRSAESSENEGSGATQRKHNCVCESVQDGEYAPLDPFCADCEGLPAGPVFYDSGWQECSEKVSVRVVFTEGPVNGFLWKWAREQILRGPRSASEGTVEKR